MAQKEALDIVVLAGGISHERDISLRSGRRVVDGLNAVGHRVALRDPDASLLGFLNETRPDVVWPALHGASGEDGALRGLLELTGVPFVGSRADASRLAWSKPTAKTLVELKQIPALLAKKKYGDTTVQAWTGIANGPIALYDDEPDGL